MASGDGRRPRNSLSRPRHAPPSAGSREPPGPALHWYRSAARTSTACSPRPAEARARRLPQLPRTFYLVRRHACNPARLHGNSEEFVFGTRRSGLYDGRIFDARRAGARLSGMLCYCFNLWYVSIPLIAVRREMDAMPWAWEKQRQCKRRTCRDRSGQGESWTSQHEIRTKFGRAGASRVNGKELGPKEGPDGRSEEGDVNLNTM